MNNIDSEDSREWAAQAYALLKQKQELKQKFHILPIHGTNKSNIDENVSNWITNTNEDDFMLNLHNQNKLAPLDVSALFIVDSYEKFYDSIFSDFKLIKKIVVIEVREKINNILIILSNIKISIQFNLNMLAKKVMIVYNK